MPDAALPLFEFEGQPLRVHLDDAGEPWFVAKDVALALGYQWNGSARIAHVPEEWKRVTSVVTLRGDAQNMQLLSEPGLYFFVARSDKPRALPFQKWLAGEVLPALRKTGRYEVPGRQPAVEPPASFPPEALRLRPAMRQKLWRDALNTARLDDGGTPAALRWFAYLCGMVAATPPAPTPARDKVRAFFWQCCEQAQDYRVAAGTLYGAFCRWCKETGQGDVPSMKAFGILMQEFAQRCRSNGSFYDGVRLKPAA